MKRFLCLLLVLVMVAVPLVACKDNSGDGKDTQGNQPGDTQAPVGTDGGTGEAAADVLDIPDTKYDGKAFNFLYEPEQNYGFFPLDFDEPSSEDAYKNAIYNRNNAVEELLGVTLVGAQQTSAANVQTAFQTDNQASSGEWHAAFNVLAYSAPTTSAGHCLSFDELPYIGMDKSWWNQDCKDQLSIGGEHYMMSGDIMIGDKDVLWAMYFIKSRLEEVIANPVNGVSLKRPYEYMAEDNWTWDNMIALASGAADDANGDDQMTIGGSDIFGFCTHAENYPAMWESAGLKLVTTDQYGEPVVEWGENERFIDVYNAACEFMDNKQVVACSSDQGGDPIAWITTAMKNNKTLFGTEVIAFVRDYRNNEEAFGILPFPKYDRNVDRYYSYVAVNSAVCCVEYTNPEPEFVGTVLEAMAAMGQKYIMPDYKDMQLKGRFSNDPESADSVDIIFNNRCYDLGVFFNWGYGDLNKSGVNAVSVWASNKKRYTREVTQTLSKLLDNA